MNPICDYHMHTPFCGHADGKPSDYALRAIQLGLKEIGFSDHAPLVSHRDPTITMDFEDLPKYHDLVEKLQKQFKEKLIIRVGIEADFIPGYERKTTEILKGYPYDYVIGSVHFIKSWAFDDPKEMNGWQGSDTNKIYRNYYAHLRKSAQSGLFDIIAHADLVKKFGHRPTVDLTDEVRKTAKVFKETGVAIEINTSGLRKPVKEIYPSLEVLKIYAKAKVPITFGSDAHAPKEVGKDFDKAVLLAKAAGYKTYVLFRQRKIGRVVKL